MKSSSASASVFCSTSGTQPAGWSVRGERPDELMPHGPMVGKIASIDIQSGITIETTLDPTNQPFLHDHQIDGTPVLPGVMGIEAFAEAALCCFPAGMWRRSKT